ncbi:hypothetical protein WICMUC_005914 [Wickerhamomyces mucosus]|uniref:mRNA-capping enzyme subunit alpha n=1 Tax=Wickerhamomyces mucosus TaxID=1378264 RepID=A0A9P8P1M3_9ASCO|nr:hypothetical protein WICMUC_005914 [Wickerhamomyces mucosus]
MLDLSREMPEIPGELMPDNIAHELQQKVINHLIGRRGMGFVGSQPVSFEAKHITENLERRDYFVCEKSDGLRCLMLCTLDPNGDEAIFLITRENQFYRIPLFHFPLPGDINSCHNGTLIDGELVLSKRADGNGKELRYLMFDCLCLNGKNIVTRTLEKRLGHLDTQFYRPYFDLRTKHPAECQSFPFKLNMKNMQPSYKLPGVVHNLKNLGHISDGLIFTCCETPYIFGSDPTLLKWKPSEENTIDFRLHFRIPLYVDEEMDERDPERAYPNYEVKPGFEIHIWHGDDNKGNSKYEYFNELALTDQEWENLKSLNEPLEERVVECNKDKNGKWRLLRFRDDKANGNHSTVVTKVLQSIQDGVSRERLLSHVDNFGKQWNKRRTDRKSHAEGTNSHHPLSHSQQQDDHLEAHHQQPDHQHIHPNHQETRQEDEELPTYEDDVNFSSDIDEL